ncbi:uncharacterized protein N7515_005068 [Penicillium bovifimosum]|uniref:N-acetyltransferase domain-containing protein n=1 Tax=Penicillium bovifimosum TaxID=126998 RepID=A0A9W9H1F9_9EURO|nr:uncharacterized protein N7515_005068 [Penicillium bovifimosum]KAJ5135790.1 hypothetical protein N7515_005068 [Penicillium bovifimosum]
MASTTNCTYTFFRVSKKDGITTSAQKFRDLRLKALKASPGSFASTYEIESAFTEAEWAQRITAPDYEVFICAATHNSPDSSEWIGQVTLRGPLSKAVYTLPAESGLTPPKPDDEEERWQMLSLFTLPGHRGLGLGAKLCQCALEYLRSYRESPGEVLVRLIVKPENQVTVKLYQRLGFGLAGKATLEEALTANGDGHLLPVDRSEAKWTERGGLIMVSRLVRS